VPIIAPAATDYNDDDITVENTSAWASFGAVASNAPSEGSAGDADMSDFSKFQRLNQEKKVRRAAVSSVSCVVSQLCYPFEHHISPATIVGHSWMLEQCTSSFSTCSGKLHVYTAPLI
jgi:hypothetical protein